MRWKNPIPQPDWYPEITSMFPKEAYVIFQHGYHHYRWFTKENFGHVGIIYKEQYHWIYTEWFCGQIATKILYDQTDVNADGEIILKDLPKEVIKNYIVVKMKVGLSVYKERNMRIKFMSCVEYAKGVIGLAHIRAITPFQLYKYIMKSELGTIEGT